MSEAIFELNASLRSDVGKGASRRLRREAGLIPAIVYGAGKEPTLITLAHNKVIRALENEAFYSHILVINLDNKKEQVVLKDMQRHPFKAKILHMDFLRIKADEKLRMTIPLHFIGEDIAPGVKLEGGAVSHHLTEVEIICLPGDLPEFIKVDMSELKLNDIVHLSKLQLPQGVELTANLEEDDADLPVASIHPPRVVEEIEETAPETAETEITTEVKPEEGKEEKENKEAKKS